MPKVVVKAPEPLAVHDVEEAGVVEEKREEPARAPRPLVLSCLRGVLIALGMQPAACTSSGLMSWLLPVFWSLLACFLAAWQGWQNVQLGDRDVTIRPIGIVVGSLVWAMPLIPYYVQLWSWRHSSGVIEQFCQLRAPFARKKEDAAAGTADEGSLQLQQWPAELLTAYRITFGAFLFVLLALTATSIVQGFSPAVVPLYIIGGFHFAAVQFVSVIAFLAAAAHARTVIGKLQATAERLAWRSADAVTSAEVSQLRSDLTQVDMLRGRIHTLGVALGYALIAQVVCMGVMSVLIAAVVLTEQPTTDAHIIALRTASVIWSAFVAILALLPMLAASRVSATLKDGIDAALACGLRRLDACVDGRVSWLLLSSARLDYVRAAGVAIGSPLVVKLLSLLFTATSLALSEVRSGG